MQIRDSIEFQRTKKMDRVLHRILIGAMVIAFIVTGHAAHPWLTYLGIVAATLGLALLQLLWLRWKVRRIVASLDAKPVDGTEPLRK